MTRVLLALLALLCARPTMAQEEPVLPATVARSAEGGTVVRAVRLTTPLRVDGTLDEAIYGEVQPVSDFIQVEPQAGAPATERTEFWITFDERNIYVSVRAFESQPDRMVVNEMRRDSFQLFQNENFQFAFDTFYDRRNAVSLQFNPLGGRMDGQITNESTFSGDWNPVWDVQVQRTADGWTAEAAVPFKSLRFPPGRSQAWGFQARRINRWKNEISYLTQLPANTASNGHARVSQYATMVGLEVPANARALDLKPFVTSALTSDHVATPRLNNALDHDIGLDVKYGVTPNITADFTVNTDFAQVEADEQQVNLTRFSLFFPEKREFFLENQGLFQFGGATGAATGDSPVLFYSRRIGLEGGGIVPIIAGGRVTGRVGRYSIGLIDMQTGDVEARGVPSTNFAVARVRRDILRRSAVGLLATRRSATANGGGAADTFGVDGTFAFFTNLTITTFWAKTNTPGLRGKDTTYRAQLNYNHDRYGMTLERLAVGDAFAPAVGFVRRDDFEKLRAQLRFSPRPARRFEAVRKFTYQSSIEYFVNGAGQKETRELIGDFQIEFETSDRLEFGVQDNFELLVVPFPIARGVTVPAGGYTLRTYRAEGVIGQQRKASGTVLLEHGPFYGGTRTSVGYSAARVKFSTHFAVEPGISVNRVRLPYGDFTARLVSSRLTYTVTPLMFISSLVQYNSSNNSLGANVRFRWEYRPGSELFVVYNEGRDTTFRGYPGLQNRAVVIKANRLLRF